MDSLKKLLDARTQLDNLKTYIDGKDQAEDTLRAALSDPTLLQALVSGAGGDNPSGDTPAE